MNCDICREKFSVGDMVYEHGSVHDMGYQSQKICKKCLNKHGRGTTDMRSFSHKYKDEICKN